MKRSPTKLDDDVKRGRPSQPKPELVKQAHGGALYRGGVRGNKGGRPRNALRYQLQRIVEEHLPEIEEIIRSKKSRDRDKIQAMEFCAKRSPDLQDESDGDKVIVIID